MASDYFAIRNENRLRYGTDIGRIGKMLLAERYADRAHFIFELLQNAEDALTRRTSIPQSRQIAFKLSNSVLEVTHYGEPFDEADVRGICGIDQSTKGLTAIGRFGIGFKSVYAFTERPEIHSGQEAFAIRDFVLPEATPSNVSAAGETIILIPLDPSDSTKSGEIAGGLERLDSTALLFLREIEEIRWEVEGGHSGMYLRETRDEEQGVRRVTILRDEDGDGDLHEEWLVFSRPVWTTQGEHAGFVELAFALSEHPDEGIRRIDQVERSPLVVFFPTVLETHLGFLLQGPYRTTPSRDNVPAGDPWNQYLVRESCGLLRESLRWLADRGLFDVAALECLPLERSKFEPPSLFAPFFETTRTALTEDPLLPAWNGGYTAAGRARLGRTHELRELLAPAQLADLLGEDVEDEGLMWLSGDITADRTPQLRRYLIQELAVAEVTPETLVQQLDRPFLKAQPDSWICHLYEYLAGQPALRRRLGDKPVVRLEDGRHVRAAVDGQPQAFLPSSIKTDFPTVRAAVCSSQSARELLESLGVAEPDLVDDVIRNVLPHYAAEEVDVDDADYSEDIDRILSAFETDSKEQRQKLIRALEATAFVMAVDTGEGHEYVARPGELYLATERLKALFSAVPGVLRVDDRYDCLRGERIRELLEVCGAVRYLRPMPDATLPWERRATLRAEAGHPGSSGRNDVISDWTLQGIDEFLDALPNAEDGAEKARLLWIELGHLEERRGKGVFAGRYTWTHYGSYEASFDAAFVRRLNSVRWIPRDDGSLGTPDGVLFETLGWNDYPFLLSKIRFRPPLLEQLAKEAGIETGVLDLLKRLGVTSEQELRERLGELEPTTAGDQPDGAVQDKGRSDQPSRAGTSANEGGAKPRQPPGRSAGNGGQGSGQSSGQPSNGSPGESTTRGDKDLERDRGGPFISYVGVNADQDAPDPDGLDHEARMALEARAIDYVLSLEPAWRRTAVNNPGFDLYHEGADRSKDSYCEVKAMRGTLADRPVGLSWTQFDHALRYRQSYWLYVVERADSDCPRLLRIQDPAGQAVTFTFDRGWAAVAISDEDG